MVSTSSKVISVPKLLTSSLGYHYKDQMAYGRWVWSSTPHNDIQSSPTANSCKWWHPSCPHPVKVRVAGVILASDPLAPIAILASLWPVEDLNWHLQSTLSRENPLDSRIWMTEGSMVGNGVTLAPLASNWHSVMAWVITHQPSCMVKGSVARYANLAMQVLAPVSVNAVSLTLPKLRPSPNDCLPQKRTAWPGPITMASVRPVLPWQSMYSTTGTIQAWGGGGVAPVSLVSVTCIPRQYLVSGWHNSFLAGDQYGEWEGHCPMLPSLQGPFSLLIVWGCGPQSGG